MFWWKAHFKVKKYDERKFRWTLIIVYLAFFFLFFLFFDVDGFMSLLSVSDFYFFNISRRLQVSFGALIFFFFFFFFHLGIIFRCERIDVCSWQVLDRLCFETHNFSRPPTVSHITWSVTANSCAPRSLAFVMTLKHVCNSSSLLSGS